MTDPETPSRAPADDDQAPDATDTTDTTDEADSTDEAVEPAFAVDLEPDEQGLAEAASESSG